MRWRSKEIRSLYLRDQLADKLPKIEFKTTTGLIELLRSVKDREEIGEIREAIGFAEKAYKGLRNTARLDQTEKDVADELEFAMCRAHECGLAFHRS